MRALSLAVRGLWWRRGSSVAIFLLAVVCAAVAAGGPAYLGGARDAVVQANLRAAPSDANGTGVSVARKVTENTRYERADDLDFDVRRSFSDLISAGVYGAPVTSVAGFVRKQAPGQATIRSPMAYRENVCAHVVVTAGSCVSDDDPAGVLMTAATATRLGVKLGDEAPYNDVSFASTTLGPLKVRGIYEPVDPGGAYWFASSHGYFGFADSTDVVLVPSTTWPLERFDANSLVAVYADLVLRPAGVDAHRLDGLQSQFDVATARLRVIGRQPSGEADSVTTNLPVVISNSELAERSLAVPVAVVAGQLVVLTIAVLFLVMVSSAESRAQELTLGKLHGLRPRSAVLHAILEPGLVLLAAVPAGVGLCWLVLDLLAHRAFGADAHAGFGVLTWLAAVAAGVGGLLATLLAATSSLRRPVLEQWRRTERRPGLRSWIVEAVVVVAAVGGAIELASRPVGDSGSDVLPLFTPALLAVAAALVGARVVPLLARLGAAATRARRGVPAFVALRQMARRRDDMRVFGLLCVTVALLVFGLASQTVFDRNRVDRARADVGADRVVTLAGSSGGTDVAAAVARLDPSGRQAAAVYQGTISVLAADDVFGDSGLLIGGDAPPPTSPSILVADPARLAAVALWRSDYANGRSFADVLAPLTRDVPAAATFTGTSLHVTGTVRASASQSVDLRVGLVTDAGRPFDVPLGTFPADGTTVAFDVTAATDQCGDGCTVRRLSLYGPTDTDRPLVGTARITGITGGTTSLLSTLAGSRWQALNPAEDGAPVIDEVRGVDGAVELDVTAVADAFDEAYGFGGYANVADDLPAVVSFGLTAGVSSATLDVEPVTGDDLDVDPHGAYVVPRAGDAGVVVSRAWLAAAQPAGYAGFAPNQVWLSPAAPADFADRLSAAGVRVAGVESVAERAEALSRQGPSFAVAMLVFGSLAAALLAVAGASVTLFVAARRRLFELAALRALGLAPRRILASLVLEHAGVAVVAGAAGLGAGLLGARFALASVPEFSDRPSFPPLLLGLPVGRVALAAVVVAVAVSVVTAVGDVVLVRRADVTRLREAQA